MSTSELADKTLTGLSKLGTQTFALSPFSQYYDDWLLNLRQVISEFESDPTVAADEIFAKERAQIFSEVERTLAELRIIEGQMEQIAKTLSDNNHLLGDADAEYAQETHELAAKRNADISRLIKKVHDLEAELDKAKRLKTSLFGLTKKAKAKKEEEINQSLLAAKSALELSVQNFDVEQEKLHDEYEKKKQEIMEKIRGLENEISGIEADGSADKRQAVCNALAAAVKAIASRKANQSAEALS